MACFDITIVAIVQFIGNEVDNFTGQIFESINSSVQNTRYVFLCLDKDNTCKVKIYQKGQTEREIPLEGKDFYTTDREKGALPVFFREYVLKDYGDPVQSGRYFMITIGHGAGFGIMTTALRQHRFMEIAHHVKMGNDPDLPTLFEQLEVKMEEDINQALLFAANSFKNNGFSIKALGSDNFKMSVNKKYNGKFNALIDGYTAEQPVISYLTSFQLAEIIVTEFREAQEKHQLRYTDNIPFDLIIQVNCYMQSIENGYALRNVTKYLCSTEIGFPTYGLSYQQLFEKLTKNPGITVEAFFKTVVDSLIRQKTMQQSAPNADNGKVALSLNSLKNYQLVYDEVSALAGQFINDINAEINQKKLGYYIYDVRDNGPFAGMGSDAYAFLDLSNFLTDLTKGLGTPIPYSLGGNLQKAIEVSDSTVVGKPFTTYQDGSPNYPRSFGIFFPRRNRILGTDTEPMLQELLDYYYDNKFSVNQNWDDFVKLYLTMDMGDYV